MITVHAWCSPILVSYHFLAQVFPGIASITFLTRKKRLLKTNEWTNERTNTALILHCRAFALLYCYVLRLHGPEDTFHSNLSNVWREISLWNPLELRMVDQDSFWEVFDWHVEIPECVFSPDETSFQVKALVSNWKLRHMNKTFSSTHRHTNTNSYKVPSLLQIHKLNPSTRSPPNHRSCSPSCSIIPKTGKQVKLCRCVFCLFVCSREHTGALGHHQIRPSLLNQRRCSRFSVLPLS